MTAGKFLIEMTDERFFMPANDEVIEFIRRVNPSAHSDVGSVLLELCADEPGAHAYSPSFKSCAYVVLHTDRNRIFAIAFGQRGLAFRLSTSEVDEAIRDGGLRESSIGNDWVRFSPWDEAGKTGTSERLRRWFARAYDAAVRTKG